MRLKPLLTILLLACAATPGVRAQPAVGAAAPRYEATSLDGSSSFSSAGHKGKVVIVNFWATWCAPCKAEMPALEAYYKKHKAEGLELLAISMDAAKDLDKVKAYAQQYSFPVAHKNSSNLKEFGRIWRLPSTFVVDRNGMLVKNGHEGEPEVTAELLESLVTPLLKPH